MVGYQTKTLDVDAGEYLHSVGVNFINMESQTGAYTVSDKLFDTTVEVDDQILVFDADEYNLTAYQKTSSGNWFVSAADGSTFNVASFVLEPGDHVLYMPVDPSKDLTVSGEVAASGTQTVTFTVTDADYLFDIANPYPVDTTIADLDSFCETDDQVLLFDADEYNLTAYQKTSAGGWFVSAANGDTYVVSDVTAVVIPAGSGGWFMPGDSRTWTVTCNYAD